MPRGLYTGKILAPNLTSHTIMALLSRTSLTICLLLVIFVSAAGCHCFDLSVVCSLCVENALFSLKLCGGGWMSSARDSYLLLIFA